MSRFRQGRRVLGPIVGGVGLRRAQPRTCGRPCSGLIVVHTGDGELMKNTLMVGSVLAATLLAGVVVAQTPAPAAPAQVARSKAPEGARVYLISPKNGETVAQKFTVQFGLKGMGVAPAGVNQANTGHHHLLVDLAQMPDMSKPLPVSDNVRHFGAGQTEVDLTLPPGKHTLQLVLGDYGHTPHEKPVVSEKITITVK